MEKKNTIINYSTQKIEGLKGILYRLKMIYYIAYSIEKPNHLKGKIESDKEGVSFALRRAPLESFLIHIRALNEFIFNIESSKKDDLRACCYLGINEAKEFKKRMDEYLLNTDERNAINKQLSHITTSEEIISQWKDTITAFRKRFFYIFSEFIKIGIINDLMKSVDRWNDFKYEEIRNNLEITITKQNDKKYLDNDTYFKPPFKGHSDCICLSTSTGATPNISNSNQKINIDEFQQPKKLPNKK